jgi:hypothetical protein
MLIFKDSYRIGDSCLDQTPACVKPFSPNNLKQASATALS